MGGRERRERDPHTEGEREKNKARDDQERWHARKAASKPRSSSSYKKTTVIVSCANVSVCALESIGGD